MKSQLLTLSGVTPSTAESRLRDVCTGSRAGTLAPVQPLCCRGYRARVPSAWYRGLQVVSADLQPLASALTRGFGSSLRDKKADCVGRKVKSTIVNALFKLGSGSFCGLRAIPPGRRCVLVVGGAKGHSEILLEFRTLAEIGREERP